MAQIDQDVLFTILNGMGIPVPQFFKEDGTPVKMSGNIAPWFELRDSAIVQQIDANKRLQRAIQTHTNVTVPPTTGINEGSWVDTNGFNEIAVNMFTDLETTFASYRLDLMWSQDGLNVVAEEKALLAENGARYRGGITPTKARFVKVRIMNKDSAAHVMNSWVYLKV